MTMCPDRNKQKDFSGFSTLETLPMDFRLSRLSPVAGACIPEVHIQKKPGPNGPGLEHLH
jgi:hypothetical protein